MSRKSSSRGLLFFLLITGAIVVVAPVVLLALMVVPGIFASQRSADITLTRVRLLSLQSSIELYALDNHELPEQLSEIVRNERDLESWAGPYSDNR